MRPSRVRSAAPTSCQSLRYRRLIASLAAAISSRSRSFSIKPGPLPSFRKLLQPEPDQPRGIRALPRTARRGGHGRRGLRLAVAELDQRGDCVHDRLRRAPVLDRAGEPDHRWIEIGERRRLVLQFRHDALGHLRTDAGRARDHGPVAHGDGGREIGGLERAEHGERNLGTDALHGLQQTEPLALDVGAKPKQPDLILTHIRLDRERDRLADARQFLQRARGALHQVADAIDVEDDEILAVTIDDALELADHARAYLADATAASKTPAKRGAARSMATFPNKQDRNLVEQPAATTAGGSVTPPPP